MWCKMASQLTAEQQQMTSICTFLNLLLDHMAPVIPTQLSGVPWNLLTIGITLLTVAMFAFMPATSFIAYMLYTTLLTFLVLKYQEAICAEEYDWHRKK